MYEKFNQYVQGLITREELTAALDEVGIQGTAEKCDGKVRFIGYDYKNQNWIKIN